MERDLDVWVLKLTPRSYNQWSGQTWPRMCSRIDVAEIDLEPVSVVS